MVTDGNNECALVGRAASYQVIIKKLEKVGGMK